MDSRKLLLLGLFAGLAALQGASGAGSWGYFGTDSGDVKWGEYNAQCSGTSQSPIDIVTASADTTYYTPFVMTGFDTTSGLSLSLGNDGHTAKLSVTAGTVTVSGGGLPSTYTMAQLHFHWGNSTTIGSEHTVNGEAFPIEMHVVTYKSTYGSLGDALSHDDGVAVIGYLFKQDSSLDSPPGLQTLVDSFGQINAADAVYTIPAFRLDTLVRSFTDFYRYSGSLTTPTCNEVVTWTVVSNIFGISETQLNAFRGLLSTEENDFGTYTMYNNFRVVQNLNGRAVYAGTSDAHRESVHLSLFVLPLISLVLNKFF